MYILFGTYIIFIIVLITESESAVFNCTYISIFLNIIFIVISKSVQAMSDIIYMGSPRMTVRVAAAAHAPEG